jgi:hypothetical protein
VSFGEIQLSGDFDQGTFVLSSIEHSRLARGYFTDYDPTKGVSLVSIGRLAGCADIEGTTISFEPAGIAQVRYFRDYLQTGLTTAGSGEDPAAVAWNLEPGVPITIKLTSPTCRQAPGPVTDGPVTYAATIIAKPGGELSSEQLFLTHGRAYLN